VSPYSVDRLGQQVGAHEVEVQEAVADRHQVGGVDVDAFRTELTDVLVGGNGVAVRVEPQGAPGVTVDQGAQGGVAGGGALPEDVVRVEVADSLVDLDVVVVEGDREARDALGRDHHAAVGGVGGLGLQVRVAALKGVVLPGRVLEDVTVPVGADTRVLALLHRVRGVGTGARVDAAVEKNDLRPVQLDDVGRAGRPVDAETELEALRRRPAALRLPGARTPGGAVVGVAVAELEAQVLGALDVLDERNQGLAEDLLHPVGTRDRKLLGTLARAPALLIREVRLVEQRFPAVLGADGDPGILGGGGELHAGVAGELPADHIRPQAGDGDERKLDVVERRLGDPADLEDVPRHAAVLGVVAAGPGARVGRVAVDDQRVLQALGVEVVVVGLGRAGLAVQTVDVEGPVVTDVTLDAGGHAVGLVLEVVVPVAALDVAAQDLHLGEVIRPVAALDAELLVLVVAQHGVVAVDVARVAEVAGGRDLGVGDVVHEHHAEVARKVVVELVVHEGAGGPPLVRPLHEVDGAIVVEVR